MDAQTPAMDQLLDYRARLLVRLERQPAEVAVALAAVPERDWHRPRHPGGRSPHMLAAHVRDLELLAFLPRIRRIRREDRPVLQQFLSHDWSDDQYRPDEPLTEILAAWSQARAEVLDLLPPPHSADWSRVGFHPPSGHRTLQWWAERIYAHAQEHRREFEAVRRP